MKKTLLLSSCVVTAFAVSLTSCIDDNYDLSDIDTTSRITVNDLTLPLNLDPIKLGDIIEIDKDSKIQSMKFGDNEFYALSENGDFKSDKISIEEVTIVPSDIKDTHETLHSILQDNLVKRAASKSISYQIVKMGESFTFDATQIDDAIVSIDKIEVKSNSASKVLDFKIKLIIDDPNREIKSMTVTDLVLNAPKGLQSADGSNAIASTGSYSQQTGEWKIPIMEVNNNIAEIALHAEAIDMKTAGAFIDSKTRNLIFESGLYLESGIVKITPNIGAILDETVYITINYDVNDFDIASFDGTLQYKLDGLKVDPVTLNDIPDFLQGGETNIELANPQIYFQLNNPVADVPLECKVGIELIASRNNLPDILFEPEQDITLGYNLGINGKYNYVLTPEGKALTTPEQFKDNLVRYNFNSLGGIMATPSSWPEHGLPNSIAINIVNPRIPSQDVKGFSLPKLLPAVKGEYQLIAPLALNDGSHIIYTDVRDGWLDEDLEKLTIKTVEITAEAINECPADLSLTIYPIGIDGKNIPGVDVETAEIKGKSANDIILKMSGEIRNLDGIRIEAVLDGTDGSALSPQQTLTLDNLKIVVGGYYENKF